MQRGKEIKYFAGAMNLDDSNEVIPRDHIASARNIIWRGEKGNMRPENIPGNRKLTNSFLPLLGTNFNLGCKFDGEKQRLFIFNYNSIGTFGIYIFYTQTGVFQRLIETNVNNTVDPLGFTATKTINSIDIIYGDGDSGDLLLYTDSLGRPTKINIDRYLGVIPGAYNPIKRPFINVMKAPPTTPPRVCYEHDTTVSANNLNGSLWKFAEGYIYDDFESSVKSSGSIMPMPTIPFSTTANVDKSKNARIAIYLQTGDANVKKLRIYGQQIQNGTTSDWLRIDTLDKTALGIPDNGIYRYVFYNAGTYPTEDVNFMNLQFDRVPPYAGCQALLNGSNLGYANIIEGYDYTSSKFSFNVVQDNPFYTVNGYLLFAAFNGTFTTTQPNVEIFVTGAGTNDPITGMPTFTDYYGTTNFIKAKSGSTDIGFFSNPGSGSVATTLNHLGTAAVAAGWSIVATNANSIVISYPSGNVTLQSSYHTAMLPYSVDTVQLAMFPESAMGFGVVYYDDDGRTNGVVTDVTAGVTTPPYIGVTVIPGFIPPIADITVNLNGVPPPFWATYGHLVRTNSLTYSKYTDWICNQAFSNINQNIDTKYAWVGITNMFDYNQEIQATSGVVSYDFAQGDRIRFRARYDINGTATAINFDYAVLGVDTNPAVNGQTQIGTFVKIAYPSADIGVNFKFDGTDNFQNYQITLYSVTSNQLPSISNLQGNVYYETGYYFSVGNPGLPTAFNSGNVGDNKIALTDGDVFIRARTVPAGNTYYVTVSDMQFSNRYATALIADPAIANSKYTIGPQNNLAASLFFNVYPTKGDSGGFYVNNSVVNQTIRLRTTIVVNTDHSTFLDVYAKIDTTATTGTIVTLVKQSDPLVPLPAGPFNVVVDATFGVPPGAKVWLLFGNWSGAVNMHIQPFQLRVDVLNNIPIWVYDKSYSDIYKLQGNSNNRPSVNDPLAKNLNLNTLFRFGGSYQKGTSINESNRFYPNDYDEFNKAYGDVVRLVSRQAELRTYQYLKVGRTGVYAKFLKDNSGQNVVVITDDIITKNNVEYDVGDYGIGNQGDSLVSSGFVDYFFDPVKKVLCRRSLDGVIPISLLYKAQAFVGAQNYLTPYNYVFGGNARVVGTFNNIKDNTPELIYTFQPGTSGAGSIAGGTIAFNESRNAFSSFYDFVPDNVVCCENTLYSFYNGELYVHDNVAAYSNFYGTQYYPVLDIVWNGDISIRKKYASIAYQSNTFWTSETNGDVITSDFNPQTLLQQISSLKDFDYEITENLRTAAFKYDANSMPNPVLAVAEGDYLLGQYIRTKLTYKGSNLVFLYNPYILWEVSNRIF